MPSLSKRDLLKNSIGDGDVVRFSLPTFLGLVATLSLFGAMLGWNADRLGRGVMSSRFTHGGLSGYEELGLAGSLVGAGIVTTLLIKAWVRLGPPRRRLLLAYAVIWLVAFFLAFSVITVAYEQLIPLFAVGPAVAIALAAILILPGTYPAEAPRPPFRFANPLRRLQPKSDVGRALLTPLSLPASARVWLNKRHLTQSKQWVLSFLVPDLAFLLLIAFGCLADPEMCFVGGMFALGMFYAPFAVVLVTLGIPMDSTSFGVVTIVIAGLIGHALIGLGFAWLNRRRRVSWWSAIAAAFVTIIALCIATIMALTATGYIM